MKKRSKVFALLVAVTVVAGALLAVPFGMGTTSILAATRPGYNDSPSWWTYDAPSQPINAFTSQTVNITNADLSNESGASSFVYSTSISGWSQVSDKTTLSGALNTQQFSKWKTDNKLTHLSYLTNTPYKSLSNANVFVMTNALHESTESKAHFTSEEIEFAANSYYIVSVDFYAVKSFGSFYLLPVDNDFDDGVAPSIALTQHVYSSGGWNGVPYQDNDGYFNVAENDSVWRTAKFLVKTDSLTSQKFNLGLYLGSEYRASKGVIYFQNPRIEQVSRDAYNNTTADSLTKQIELDDKDVYEINYKSSDKLSVMDINSRTDEQTELKYDPTDPDGYNKFSFVDGNQTQEDVSAELYGTFARYESTARIPQILNYKEVDDVHLPHRAGDASIMLLAANESAASLKLDKPFVVKRHQIYMVSYYTLTADGSAASVRVRDIRYKDDDLPSIITPFDSGHVNISTTGTDTLNGWTLNTFFIVGESYYDIAVDIEFWIGTEEQSAFDYMLIDEFQIQRVSTEYYHNFHDNENYTNMTLDTNEPTVSVSNAYFNLGAPSSVDSPYPLQASSWTATYGNQDLTTSGIVNTEQVHWNENSSAGLDENGRPNASHYGNAKRPHDIVGKDTNNNVYMMQNTGNTWQTLSSNSFGLNIGVYTVITFDIARQYYPFQGLNFWASVTTTDGTEIARIDLGEPSTTSTDLERTGWETYSFAIKESAITTREVTLTFNMGSADKPCATAVVFLDNISVTQANSDDAVPEGAVKADLTDPTNYFVAEEQSTAVSTSHGILYVQNFENKKSAAVTNTLTETLTGGNFYEYTVYVKIVDGASYYIQKFDEDGKDITEYKTTFDKGINFRLTEFEGGFEHLNAADIIKMGVLDADGYAQLKFYIRPDVQSELALQIVFGNDNMAVTGEVYLKNFSLRQIEETDFTDAKSEYDTAKKNDDVKGYTNISIITESYVPPEDGDGSGSSPVEWWIVVPSIIMAVAILVAIAGFLWKRNRFKAHIEKHHTSYATDDRSARKTKKEQKIKK